MNFKEALYKMCDVFVKNYEKLPVEDCGLMTLTLNLVVYTEDSQTEVTQSNVNFVQLKDETFQIEDANIVTTLYGKNNAVIRAELEEILI
jgi:hypothetical protein